MRASESSFESYKLTRIFFFANFICSSVSGQKKVSAFCQIQLQWKVTEHFLNRIKKCGVIVQKSLSEKKYVEIKNLQTRFFSALGLETGNSC